MIRLILALSLAALSSCSAISRHQNDHWNGRSVLPRAVRFFTGYDAELDGSYRDFAWERKKDVELVARRYFLNHNPENPYQTGSKRLYARRPPNSLIWSPHNYIHGEGLIMGFVMLASTGAYIPLPLDSLIGTFFEPGGLKEFTTGEIQ